MCCCHDQQHQQPSKTQTYYDIIIRDVCIKQELASPGTVHTVHYQTLLLRYRAELAVIMCEGRFLLIHSVIVLVFMCINLLIYIDA